MLSYLHSYHAGNRADVHKHRALARLLVHLTAKPRAITYMETHAGRGLYDLSGPEAAKTGEASQGIGQLADDGDNRDPYLAAVADVRKKCGAAFYPGSPLIARHFLRSGDLMHLMELHPAENKALKRAMKGTGAQIHRRDGFEGVLAISPPSPRRGLVLIDPSYEVKDEYGVTARFIEALLGKWPEAVVLLWYPLLAEGRHKAMIERLAAADLPVLEHHEVMFPGPEDRPGMLGSGLRIINKPYGYSLKDTAEN